MRVNTLSTTTVDEIEFRLDACDVGRESAHYAVTVTRRDDIATKDCHGWIIGRVQFPFTDDGGAQARATHALLIEVGHVGLMRTALRGACPPICDNRLAAEALPVGHKGLSDSVLGIANTIKAARPGVEVDIPIAGFGAGSPQGLRFGMPDGTVFFASSAEGGMVEDGETWSVLVYENASDYEDGEVAQTIIVGFDALSEYVCKYEG